MVDAEAACGRPGAFRPPAVLRSVWSERRRPCDRILHRWEAYAKDEAEQLVCGYAGAAEGRMRAAE